MAGIADHRVRHHQGWANHPHAGNGAGKTKAMKRFPRPKEYAPCPWCGKQPEECVQGAPTGIFGKQRAIDVDVACRNDRCPVKPQGPHIREPITGKETIGEDLKATPSAWEAAVIRARRVLAKAWNKRATPALLAWELRAKR